MSKRPNNITSIDNTPRPTRRGENGRVALAAYATHRRLPKAERYPTCTVTDAIADLLHYADECGYDSGRLWYSAVKHDQAEYVQRTIRQRP